MRNRWLIRSLTCASILAVCPWSLAQHKPTRPSAPLYSDQGSFEERERAELLGRLVYKNIHATFNETPIQDVFREVSNQIGATVIGRYATDRQPLGLLPQTTITAEFKNHPAKGVLEEIVEQCSDSGDCTWQLRKGFIEVSTKARLSVPAARDLRAYHVRDLMLEPPDFGGGSESRKSPEEIAAQLFSTIIDVVEPQAWEPVDEQPLDGERAVPAGDRRTFSPPPVNTRGKHDPKNAQNWISHVKRGGALQVRGKWATMRLVRDQLFVNAPDFIHREINGYPAAIRPADVDPPQPPAHDAAVPTKSEDQPEKTPAGDRRPAN